MKSSMVTIYVLLGALTISCDLEDQPQENVQKNEDVKEVTVKSESGKFWLHIPSDLFEEQVAKLVVVLSNDQKTYSKEFSSEDDIRFDDIEPGEYEIKIDVYLSDLTLIDYTGSGQITVNPQQEVTANIELSPASMNGSVSIEISKAAEEPSFETAKMRPYECFDLKSGKIVEGDDILMDCYGSGYDFNFAWNGNVNRPAFFFNEPHSDAHVIPVDFDDVNLSHFANLCDHLNDQNCNRPSWTLTTSSNLTAIIKTTAGDHFKVALTGETPTYQEINFRYQRVEN